MEQHPHKLEDDPILEAIFEIRFTSRTENVADLLPGLLFQSLREKYPKLEALSIFSVPREIREADPNFKYKPTHRLLGDNYAITTGEHVVSLSCNKPYSGWIKFRPVIKETLSYLKDTMLVDNVHRFSMKYVNLLIEDKIPLQLGMIKNKIVLGSHDLSSTLTNIRTEIDKNDFINIVQVVSGATARVKTGQEIKGLILEIDTIYNKQFKDFWIDIDELLDSAHTTEKSIFFDILTEETIKKLKPVWEKQ